MCSRFRLQILFLWALPLFAFERSIDTISVIVPCHPAHFPLLEELVDAYAAQTLLPTEVVISLSESNKIGEPLLIALEQRPLPFALKLIKHREKQYAAANRKAAVQASRGQLLLFQDADDLPHPQRVEIVKYIFEHNWVEHLIHSFVPEGEEFTPYQTDAIPLIEVNLDFLFCGLPGEGDQRIPLHHGNVCMMRAVAMKGQWKATDEAGEDLHFNIAAHAFFRKMAFATPLRLILFRSSLSYFSNK